MTKRSKASAAVAKGWETRRANVARAERDARRAERRARIESLRRSERARKGWETRRDAERQKRLEHERRTAEGKQQAERRAAAARKGWETRRAKAEKAKRSGGGTGWRDYEIFEDIDDGDVWEIEVSIDYEA